MQSPKSLSLKHLTNETLLSNTKTLVTEERKLTTEILWHLHEIQKRRLYAEKGYASLFEYAVQALGYSEAAAGRRIAAMRFLVEVPEIEPALQKGEVNLSTLSTIQSFIQRKVEPVSKQEKKELVLALRGKSRRECEKHLVTLDPAAATPKEKERVISPTQTEIRFVADDLLMEKLKQIKELDGHVQSNPSYLELFHRVADIALKKLDPLNTKKAKNQINSQTQSTTTPTPPAESVQSDDTSTSNPTKNLNSRYIPAAIKREIWRRGQSRCSYKSADGKRCTSRFALEIDHKTPLALGGKTELTNLRLLCRAHNTQQAVFMLGEGLMRNYVR